MSEPGHVDEPGGVVVQTEGGDPEPVDVMRRGRDVVLGESISAETGVNQRPAPPTPKAQGHDCTPIYSISRTTHRNCAIFGFGAKEQRRCTASAVPLHLCVRISCFREAPCRACRLRGESAAHSSHQGGCW